MTAKELSFSSHVYRVSRDKILGTSVSSIRRRSDGIFVINERFECMANEKLASSMTHGTEDVLFFDLEEAKTHQAILREEHIKELQEAAKEALEKYHKTVEHYLYMPISEPIHV